MELRKTEVEIPLCVRRAKACVWAALVVAAWAPQAAAQSTRTAEIIRQQEEKAAHTEPYRPGTFEKVMNALEESFASPPDGFYPAMGSIYPGGGLTLGVGFRQFFAREAVWDIKGMYSIKNYKLIEVGARTPWNNSGRTSFGVRAGWRDAPEVGYYGTGMETSPDSRRNFGIKQTYGGGHASVRPSSWTRLEADVAVEGFKNEEGRGRAGSIETLFDAASAPGLFSTPTYIHSRGTAAIDWRPSATYARTGGYYGVSFVDYSDVDDTFGFQRIEGDLVQHIPILRETWVVSLRGRVQTTVDDDDVVPYYLMPYLGSGSTLRAYSTGRFRDRHALLTSAELRWIPNRLAMDMALFFDAGKVTNRRKDLDFDNLKSDWGIGARFHTPAATVLRIEMAKGTEGWHLVFASSAAF